jgi:hypothetical protein
MRELPINEFDFWLRRPGMSLTFSFVSAKKGDMVLLAVEMLVKRGRLGPFELKSVMKFTKEPALYLEVSS